MVDHLQEMWKSILQPEDNESLFCCATAFTIKSVIGINSGMLVVHMKQGGKQNSEQGGSNSETKNWLKEREPHVK